MQTHSLMRGPATALVLAAMLAGCSDAVTGVVYALDTTLTTSSLPVSPSSVDILGDGDEIVVTIVRPNSCGFSISSSASRLSSTIDVNLTFTSTAPLACLPTIGSTSYRIAV